MTRKQGLIWILSNAFAIILLQVIPLDPRIRLIVLAAGNLFAQHKAILSLKEDKEKAVLQLKSLAVQQEKNFKVKAAQLETIVSNLPFPMALIDNQGAVILSNTLFRQFKEDSPGAVESDTKFYIPEIRSFIRNTYIAEEAALKTINVNTIDYQAISVPVYDDKARYSGCLVMFLDITQILEGERIQKRFIADASHELKTPLSSIIGMIQILNRPDFKDEETRKEFSTQIQQEAHRMDGIIQDLLTLSKYSSRQIILEIERLRLADLVDSAYAPLKPRFEQKHLAFITDIDEKIYLYADKDKFHQILTNLMVNALKFTDQGSVKIDAKRQDGFCILTISDTGQGIPKEDQKYIFERFYRADQSRSRQSGGSGLGLAIVKAYLSAHKADIEVISEVNQGTSFIIRIPLGN